MTVLHGDCTEVLKTIEAESVDFGLMDPPYFVAYKDRTGRRVKNDTPEDMAKVLRAFPEIYRVMKPGTLIVCFYGWQSVDAFMAAWKGAGFTPVEHIVWKKKYASSRRFLNRRHEQAYVLAKGKAPRPYFPALDDVMKWEYSGNKSHPTEKHVRILAPLIEAFTGKHATVLDPFAGSGSTLVAAALTGRKYIGIEMERKYCRIAERRLAGVARYIARC